MSDTTASGQTPTGVGTPPIKTLVPVPDDKPAAGNTIDQLWLILVWTLAIVIVGSLVGTIVLVAMKLDASLVIGIGSAALTGMLGLFVSPGSGGSGGTSGK